VISYFNCLTEEWLSIKDKKNNLGWAVGMSLVVGIISHGFFMTNKFSYHDDLTALFSGGASYSSGRWALGILSKISRLLFGGECSIPFYNGIMNIIILSIAAILIIMMFDVQTKCVSALIGMIIVSHPTVACILTYGGGSIYYQISFLLSILGAYILVNKKFGRMRYILSAFIICFATAIYQSYFQVATLLVVFYLFMQTLRENSWKTILKDGIIYLIVLIFAIGSYIFLARIIANVLVGGLSSYAGIDNMGQISVIDLIGGVGKAYLSIIPFANQNISDLFGGSMEYIYYIIYVLLIALVIQTIKVNPHDKFIIFERVIFFMLIPLAMNLVCIMQVNNFGYSMTSTSLVFIFVLAMIFSERICTRESQVVRFGYIIILTCVLISSIYYARLDNKFYLKEEFLKTQTISYFTAMVSEIRSLNEYSDELPVAYIGIEHLNDKTLTYIPEFTNINMRPFHRNELITEHNMDKYMAYWCGFQPEKYEDIKTLQSNATVQSMPSYPDAGAIQIIDGVIVVKLGDI